MTVQALVSECQRALDAGLEAVALVVPRPATGRLHMRLFGRSGPLGEIMTENAEGHAVLRVMIVDLLAYLAAQGLVEVKAQSQRPKL